MQQQQCRRTSEHLQADVARCYLLVRVLLERMGCCVQAANLKSSFAVFSIFPAWEEMHYYYSGYIYENRPSTSAFNLL
jgi:hypothetical protein